MNNLEEKILKLGLEFYKKREYKKYIIQLPNPEGCALLEALIEIRREQGFGNLITWKDIEISLRKWLGMKDNKRYDSAFNFVKEQLNNFHFTTMRLMKNE